MKNKKFDTDEQKILSSIIQHRRDIRGNNFLNTPITEEALNQILHSAKLAPSVGLSQPWEFVLIKDEKIKDKILQNHLIENEKAQEQFTTEQQKIYRQLKLEGIKEAPINLAVFYTPATTPILGQNSMAEMGEYSVVCAVQNMWLTARALNIGLGWVSILNPDKVKQTLNAPKTHKLVAYLCLGYVKEFLDVPELEVLNWKNRQDLTVIENSY